MKRIITIALSLIILSSSLNPVEAQVNKSKSQQEAEYQRQKQQREAEYQRQKQQRESDAARAKQQAEAEMQRAKQQAAQQIAEKKRREAEKKEMETSRYYSILDSRDLQQYNSFISDYPQGDFTPEIRNRAAEVKLWREAEAKGTVAGYENYLSSSQYLWFDRKANDAITAIKKKADRAQWQKVVAKNTIEDYEKYLSQYPNSGYKADAQAAISGLKAQKDWEVFSNAPSINGLEEYIAKYPNAKNIETAKQRLYILKAENYYADGNISAAYSEFSKVETSALSPGERNTYNAVVEDYKFAALSEYSPEKVLFDFQKEYPNGKHYAQVNNLIAVSKALSLNMFSTQSDYNQALSYAGDVETRAIVNRHISRSKAMYKEYKKEAKKHVRNANGGWVNLGFEFMDFNVGVSRFDRFAYSYNIGLLLRVGNFNDRVQFALGVKPGIIGHTIEDEYYYDYDYNYYGSYDDSESDETKSDFHLPVVAQLKLNLFKSSESSRCFIFGQFQYNAMRPKYIEAEMAWAAGFGFAWPHFDLSFKYSQDIKSCDFCNRIKHFGGISMIYYWHL